MSVMFLGTRFQSFKNDGTVNNDGTVEFYETGGSTHKDTYSDSGLTVANTWPVTLNSAGAADIWYDGNADVVVKDSTGTIVDSFTAINPSEVGTSIAPNIALNGSFEDLSGTNPTNWVQTLYSAGAGVQDTDSIHGKYSWKFTSAGSGGGYITSETAFLVAYNRPILLYWDMKSSVADVRNVIDILWYDDTDSLLSTTTAYDNSTTNPTSYTRKYYTATPPVNAVTAKLRLYGCHSSDNTAGSTWYDNVYIVDGGFLGNDLTLSGTTIVSGSVTLSGLVTVSGLTKFAKAIGANYLNNAAFSATAAANALTVTLLGEDAAEPSSTNPVEVAFRSTTLTTGTSTVRTATAATTVVVPDGATLGFIANEASYIYVYLIDNAGTVELAVSGNPQNTAGLVSTTAIGTGSDTKATLYSTSARTNVACRYLGKILLTTGATPGQWSTPTSLHSVTDEPPMWSVGYGQTWQTVTGSRAFNTNYTNSTGRPIMVSVYATVLNGTGTVDNIIVDGVNLGGIINDSGGGQHRAQITALVPPGSVYSVATSGAPTLNLWAELR